MNKKIIVYTDGACSGNQSDSNFGGWGYVITLPNSEKQKTKFGAVVNTTNNKMELIAPIAALSYIRDKLNNPNIPVEIHSDSAYVVNGMNSWIEGWKARDWRKSDKKPVENVELWQELDGVVGWFRKVSFFKVVGHAGHPLNELADQLANQGVKLAKMTKVD